MSLWINYTHEEIDEAKYRFRPYTITHEWRKLTTPMLVDGNLTTRYKAPCITEYVDMETGEVISASALKRNPEVQPTFHFSEAALQREFILTNLRKEVREFALFILKFRNQRRGVTPGVDTLVRWYAKLTDKQACHVQRNVKRLEDAKILAGSSLLGPLFQIAGKNIPPRAHLSEDSIASITFMRILIKKKVEMQNKTSFQETSQPSFADKPIACTSTVSKGKTTVFEFLQSLINAGKLEAQFPSLAA